MKSRNLLSLSLTIAVSLAAPAAPAWPLGHLLHLHPDAAAAKDGGVKFRLYNSSAVVQNIEVGSRKFALAPNSGVKVNAPAGTPVVTQTATAGVRPGDTLFAVKPTLRHTTVT